jgi:hypothetical protein
MRAAGTLWVALCMTAATAQDPPATLPPVIAPPAVTPPPPPPPPPVVPPPPDEPPLFCTMPTGPKPGVYVGLDLTLAAPHVANGLHANVFTPPVFLDEVRLPGADLDGTLSPKLTLGYRFANGCGGVAFTYRNMATDGHEVVDGLDPLGESSLFSRLDINEVGVHYTTSEFPLGALWGLRWEVGARLASIYFDSQSSGLLLGQRTSNHFVGAGPQVALDATRELPGTGFALFGRADFADMLGRIQQRFAERVGDPAAPVGVGTAGQDGNQAVPYFGLQLGASWLSHPSGRYRITAGYQFDQWWNVGKVGDSRGDVQSHGLFLRSELNF